VLTNGDEYRIYKAHEDVPVEDKLLRSVRVTELSPDLEATLLLLSKDELKTNRLEALWRANFVDRQVRAALARFFSRDEDMVLVNHVLRLTKHLSADEVRSSIRRCKVNLEFPVTPDEMLASAAGRPRARRRRGRRPSSTNATHDVTVLDLVESGLLQPPVQLQCKYKGRDLVASIDADGAEEFGGTKHQSLSLAAGAARASVIGLRPKGRSPPTNGWTFWKYLSADGTMRPMDEARRAFVEGGRSMPRASSESGGRVG